MQGNREAEREKGREKIRKKIEFYRDGKNIWSARDDARCHSLREVVTGFEWRETY